MAPRKGQNNFRASQQATLSAHLSLVESELARIPNRVFFSSEGNLIEYLAQRTGLHRTTIKRNHLYYGQVAKWYAKQPGLRHRDGNKNASVAQLRAKILDLEIQLRLTREEATRLKQSSISTMQAEVTRLRSADGRIRKDDLCPGNESSVDRDTNRREIEASQIAMSLFLLLRHLREKDLAIEMDRRQCEIVDLGESGENRVIVPATRARAFVDWCERNKGLINNISK